MTCVARSHELWTTIDNLSPQLLISLGCAPEMAHFYPLVTIMSQLEPNGKLRKSQNVTKVPQLSLGSPKSSRLVRRLFSTGSRFGGCFCTRSFRPVTAMYPTPGARIATTVSQVEQKGGKGYLKEEGKTADITRFIRTSILWLVWHSTCDSMNNQLKAVIKK